MRPHRASSSSSSAARRLLLHSRARMAFSAVLACTVLYLAGRRWSPLSGHTLVQCVFKAYKPVDTYAKSGARYDSLSAVLAAHGGGGWGSPTLPTDKATTHDYIRTYDELMRPYAEMSDGARVLEVGVKKGGSIKLWREYFPDGARIFGSDIDPTIATFSHDMGIKTVVCDSTDAVQVDAAFRGQTFDVVFDDGCHLLGCIKQTFENLFPRLAPGGLYVVEDYPKYYKSKGKSWRPAVLFGGEGRTVCSRVDGNNELLVVVSPPDSRAPRVDFCTDSKP